MCRLLISVGLLVALGMSASERNVVLIITDDQSPTLGCYGDPVAVTPHLDRLAEDGVRFTHAFATTASCSASRSVIMSGIHNHANGLYGHTHKYHKFASYLDVVSLSLPRVMANEGYRTALIGKYHVAPEEVYHFETRLHGNKRNPIQMAENCREFIEADPGKPFFLYFATDDPHRGGGRDESFAGENKPDLFGNLPGQGSHTGVNEVVYNPAAVPVPAFLPDSPESRAELAQYYQSSSRIDQGVGHLMEILKEAGVYDKTLIIFTSDHGMAFPGAKTTIYEAGLHVPFIVRNPYLRKRGLVSEAMISHLDITPSILDFAGGLDPETNAPKQWLDPDDYWQDKPYAMTENRSGGNRFEFYQGRSWLSRLSTEDGAGWDAVTGSHTFHEIQMYYPMRSYRDRKYKLIWNIAHNLPYPFASDLWASATWQAQWQKGPGAPFGGRTVDSYIHRPAFELYDMRNDPAETTNLAENPEYAEVLKAYQAKLKAFQENTKDPWLLKWRYE